MKKVALGSVTLLAALSLLLGGFGCTGTSPSPASSPKSAPAPTPASVTLKFIQLDPPTSTTYLYVNQFFADEVERQTEGRVKMQIFPIGALGKGPDHYDMIVKGVADVAFSLPAYTPGRFPFFTLGDLPFAYPSGALGSLAMELLRLRGVFDKEYGEVKLLSASVASPYYIFTRNKKITTVDDLKGLKLRVSGDYQSRSAKKLGIVPIFQPMEEQYQALSTGVLDGTITSYSMAESFRFSEVTKYISEYALMTGTETWIMNKDVFAKLSPRDQRVIEDVGAQCGLRYGAYFDYVQDTLRAKFIGLGIQVSKPSNAELDQAKKVVQPVYDEWITDMEGKGLPGKQVMADFLKLRQGLGLEHRF